MKIQNSLTNTQPKQTFSTAVTGASLQNLIRKSVPDSASAARLTGALISSVAASPQLQKCNPASIVAAALRGEGMGLTLGREYHLLPFQETCAFVISYKGLIALSLATGDVADIDVITVREGEYIGRDPRTKRMRFDFSVYKTDEEAQQHPEIGVYAYCETKSNYFRYEYMSFNDVVDHARRYSKSFDYEKYTKLSNGEYSPAEAEKVRASSPWYGNFELMAKKTVLRRLLNSGFVRLANSLSLKEALYNDTASEDGIIPDLDLGSVDTTTGEVIETTATVSDAEIEPTTNENEKTQKNTAKSKRSDSGSKNADSGDSNADFTNGFFGG